jgi:hypothetical protein
MDNNTSSPGYIAYDLISRYRIAASGNINQHVPVFSNPDSQGMPPFSMSLFFPGFFSLWLRRRKMKIRLFLGYNMTVNNNARIILFKPAPYLGTSTGCSYVPKPG